MGRLSIRIDDKLKEEANELFEEFGMDMSTAIKVYLKQSVKEGRIPFIIGEPKESIQARKEANRGEGTTYHSVEEMMRNLDED